MRLSSHLTRKPAFGDVINAIVPRQNPVRDLVADRGADL